MLLFRKEPGVGSQMVGEDRLVPVIGGHIGPDEFEHRVGAIPNDETDDLTDQTGDCRPEPEAGRDTDTQFIDLDGILLRGRYGGDALFLDARLYPGGVFFRRARIVWRPTLRARAIPLWEMRS
jgi:hypothetical protein